MKITLPSKISLSRLFLALVLFAVYCLTFIESINVEIQYVGFTYIDLACAIIFGIAALTDLFDGKIARKRNLVSDFGKFIDPIADKFLINGTLILLSTRLDSNGHFYIFPVITVLFICRDILMDGLRFMLAKKNVVLAANIFGKLKTVFQSAIIPIALLNGFPFSLVSLAVPEFVDYVYIITNVLALVTLFMSVFSCIIYFRTCSYVFKEEKGEEKWAFTTNF